MYQLFFAITQASNVFLSIGVQPINEISVEAAAVPVHLSANATHASYQSSYSITTNEKGKKIIGFLESPLPDLLTVSVTLQPPAGATSHGPILLSCTPQTFVSNISPIAQSDLKITYTFSMESPLPSDQYTKALRFSLID